MTSEHHSGRRQPRRPVLRSAVTTLMVAATSIVLPIGGTTVDAALQRSFSIRYQADTNGAIDIFGNTLLTCPGSCPTAQNPAGVNDRYNNEYDMVVVDADADASTSNSSSATATIPAGSTVLFAGLYWGAQSSSGSRNQIRFRTPGGAYSTVTASQLDTSGTDYQAFRDVTALVAAAGAGEYWAADIRAQANSNDYAGWALIVAYENPSLPLRNLTVFDGYGIVRNSGADRVVDVPISGFLTPPFGTVNAEVGVIAYEGDGGIRGDQFFLNGVALTNGQNPADDFFNSTVSTAGVNDGGRNPDYQNTLGFDADEVDASGILGNASTSATVRLTTTGDAYYPGALTTQIDLFAPVFPEVTKTVVDVNGGTAKVGDTLRYSVSLTNVGLDPARQSVITDSIPADTTYVPNSLRVNGVSVSDTPGNDVGDFDGTRVRGFVGAGATSSAGGTLGPNASASIAFDVTIDAPAAGRTVANQGRFDYVAQTLNRPFTFRTNTVVTPVDPLADLSIVKSAVPATFVAGAPATYTLAVSNAGPNPAPNVTVTDVLPPALAAATVSSTSGTCTNTSGTIGCSLGTMAVGAVETITVTATLAAAIDPATVLTNTATVTGSVTDSNPGNNASTVLTDVDASADLSVTKSASPTTAVAGDPITYTITASNAGPSSAANVQISEALPASLLGALLTPGVDGSCAGTTCTFASVAPGAAVTVTVTGTVASSASGSMTNTATVSAATPDPVAGNNEAVVITPVDASADLVVAKTASPSPAVPGETIEYTVTVTNAGPSDAVGVTVSDPVPALTGVSATSSAGACTVGASVDCSIPTIPAGETVTATITGTIDPARTLDLVNTASATSATPDPAPGNNSGTAATPMLPAADLSITKTASPNPVTAGNTVTYTITVANSGPSNAANVVVADTLPPELVGGAATSSQGSCTGTSCDLGAVAAGATATVTITADVPASIDPTTVADNTATVSSATTDPDATDNDATISTDVTAIADLRLTKAATPTTVVAGGVATWTIVVTNDGPSDADAFDVLDTLAPALAPAAATVDGTPCVIVGQSVTCSSAGLALGASATVLISAAVQPDAPAGSIPNTAAIANETTTDPTTSNNSASASVAVTRSADLSMTKTAVTDPITPGLPATFTLEITNAGPSSGNAVLAADGLPVGWTLDPSSDPRCTLVSGNVSCDVGVLAPLASELLTLVVVPPPNAATGPITNTATVSSSTPDPTPADNTSSDTADVAAVADLSVTKTDLADPVVAGEGIGYTIEVSNAGPSDATSVTLDESDLAALDTVAMAPSQGTCELVTFTCDLGTIPPGTVVTVAVSATVPVATAAGVDVLSNTVTVAAPADTNAANDAATETTSVERSADLVVAKSVSPLTAVAGDPVTWTITTTNQGPSAAADVVVTDSLPAGLVAATVVVVTDRGSCITAAAVTCDVGALLPGETATVTVSAQIDPGFAGTTLANTAAATSPDPDDNLADNTASAVVPVVSLADLTITKNPSNPMPVAGEALDWVVQVVNAGPSTALDVAVADVVPAGFVVSSITSSPAGCTALPCDLGDLPVGSLVTIVVAGIIDPGELGTISNSASVTSATDDPNGADNSVTADADVIAVADLSVAKVGDLPEFVAGQSASWTISVTNAGPSDATSVVVTDTLPAAGFSGISSTPSQGSCPDTATCDLGTLAAGQTATVVVAGTVSAAFTAADITNAASVSTATFDPDAADDTSSSTVPVVPVADLSILKLAVAEPFVPGEPVAWSLAVTNNGPSSSEGVNVGDTLPAGATITSATTSTGSCAGAGTSTLSCDLGTLAPGVTATVDLVADLDPSVSPGTLGNTASVTSTTADPDAANDSSTATADVAGRADLVAGKTLTSSVTAGSPISWDLTVANEGPSNGADVIITDVVPAGVTLDPLPAGCTGTDTIVCTVASLADGASATFSIAGTLDPDVRGTFTNTATVAGATADPDTTDNSATVTSPIAVTSDVVLTKLAPSPAPVPGGAPGRWTITLTNNGPSTANGVVIDDLIPPTPTLVGTVIGVAGTLGSCDTSVTCVIGDVPPGTTVTVLVDIEYPANATEGTVSNTADVAASTPLTGTTSATDTFDLAGSADIFATKTIFPDTAVAGGPATYRIEITNSGPSDASNVTVSDVLPPAATSPTLVDPLLPCVVGAGSLTCLFPVVDAGRTVRIDVSFIVASGAVGALDNTVQVMSTTADPDLANNVASVTAGVVTVADLSVDKRVVTSGPYVAGDATPTVYEIEVINDGPSDAAAVVVADQLPPGFVVAGPITNLGLVPLTCGAAGSAVTCDPTTIPAGFFAIVRIPVTIASDTPAGPALNLVDVSSVTTDPAPDNNADEVSVTVVRSTTVVFDKVADAAGVVAGQTAGWTISGSVTGPSSAEASTVSDTLPAGFTPTIAILTIDGTVVPGGCAVSGRAISCALGDLAPGSTFEVAVSASIDPDLVDGVSTNAANFSTITPGGSAAASDDVTVGRVAPITVAKAPIGAGPFLAGEPLDWVVTVTNPGPSTSRNIELTELAPAGYTVLGLEASQGGCVLPATCTLGELPVGGVATVTIRGIVDPAAPAATMTNEVSVATAELADPATATGDAAIEREASLRLAKAAAPVVATAGEALTWTITLSNDGPSTSSVTVTDLIPAELEGATVTPSAGTWAAPDWAVTALAPGASATLVIDGTLASSYTAPSIANAATLVADTPNPGDTSAGVTTPVVVDTDLVIAKRTVTTPIVAGAVVTWEIDVTNEGSSDALAVVLTDALPPETVPDSATLTVAPVTAAVCDDATTTCDFGTIAAGTPTATVTVTAVLAADAVLGETLVNGASVSTSTPETDTADNTAGTSDPITTVADLTIDKRTITSPLVAGSPATWQIDVVNTGPSDAQSIEVTDTAPAGLIGAVATSADATCAGLVCSVDTLAAGESIVVTVTGTLDPSLPEGSPVDNAAEVTSPTDPDSGTISDSTTDAVTTEADLAVAKAVTTPPVAGGAVAWSITVTNDGPSDAQNVVVTDSVPAEVTTPSFTPSQGSCDAAGRCDLGTIAAGGTATIAVTASVPADVPDATTITNVADVTSATTDPDTTNDSVSVDADVATSADVSVTKTGPATAVPGESITWTIEVVNDGPSDAQNVVVGDAVPTNVTGATFSTAYPGTSCDATGCTITTLANGDTAVITGNADVDPTTLVAVDNAVTVSADTSDPDPTDNADDATSAATPQADLSVAKAIVTDPVVAGEAVEWAITVTNNGPSQALDVDVSDTPPVGVTGVVMTIDPADGTCVGLTCTIPTLPSGATVAIGVVGDLDPAAPDASTIANAAEVASAATPDPEPANDAVVSAPATVTTSADLTIEKTTVTTPIVAGGPVEWSITVINVGPSDAQNVTVDDTLPAEAVDVSLAPDQGTCDAAGSCDLGTIVAGGSVDIVVTATVDPAAPDGGDLANSATVVADTADPDPGSNTAAALDTITTVADVGVALTAPVVVTPGAPATWTVALTNAGASDAQNVVVAFPVPDGVTITDLDPDGPCVLAGGVITCTFATLPAGGAITLSFTGDVDPARIDPIEASVGVLSATVDPHPANNTDAATSDVAPSADLSVTKSGPALLVAGTAAAWEIVVANAGPSDAVDVVLTDVLPPGLIEPAVSDGACAVAAGEVECLWAVLESGGTRTVIVSAVVLSTYDAANLLNTASVASATLDPDTSNNTSTADSEATGRYDLVLTKTATAESLPYYGTTTFALGVVNGGPSTARDVVIVDDVPLGLAVVATSSECSTDGSRVTCTVGDLDVGEEATVEITVLGDVPGAIENCAAVAGRTVASDVPMAVERLAVDGDTDTTNDEACATVTVGDAAELTVAKSTAITTAAVGSIVVWTVTVHNDAPSAARDVVVTARPGAGLAVESASATSGRYDSAAGVWSIDSSPPGTTATLTVRTRVTASGTLTNSVELASATPDARLARSGSPASPIVASSSGTVVVSARPLPATGNNSSDLVGTAIALVMAGAVLFVASRRRRRQPVTSAR